MYVHRPKEEVKSYLEPRGFRIGSRCLPFLCHHPQSHQSLQGEPWGPCLTHLYNPIPRPGTQVPQMSMDFLNLQDQRRERKTKEGRATETKINSGEIIAIILAVITSILQDRQL